MRQMDEWGVGGPKVAGEEGSMRIFFGVSCTWWFGRGFPTAELVVELQVSAAIEP